MPLASTTALTTHEAAISVHGTIGSAPAETEPWRMYFELNICLSTWQQGEYFGYLSRAFCAREPPSEHRYHCSVPVWIHMAKIRRDFIDSHILLCIYLIPKCLCNFIKTAVFLILILIIGHGAPIERLAFPITLYHIVIGRAARGCGGILIKQSFHEGSNLLSIIRLFWAFLLAIFIITVIIGVVIAVFIN